jgi:glycosyltransferase involved in cell wall biosynthesis
MAYGRPLVATRVGGLADLDGSGVVLVPPRDPVALRGAIQELLGDAAERSRLGAAAREAAASRFSHDACARALVGVYEAALR